MGWTDAFQDDHNEVHHKGSYTHDALGGAVAYEAFKAYEDHLAANGQPDDHAKAKEIFAGILGAVTTQLVETKGLDAYDSYKQKSLHKKAEEHFEETYSRR